MVISIFYTNFDERYGMERVSIGQFWILEFVVQVAAGLLSKNTDLVFAPEENPFESVICDLTHRCNMQCKNCYIPNRDIPDMDPDWLLSIVKRFPKRTKVRLVGAEPTLYPHLTYLVRELRRLKHWPFLLTNGLRLADPHFVAELKQAGLHFVYLSFNGGFDDTCYEAIDEMPAAAKKVRALENLVQANFYVSLGMIIVRGINEQQIGPVFRRALEVPQIRELKLRSVGLLGRHMETVPYQLEDLIQLFHTHSGRRVDAMETFAEGEYMARYRDGRLIVQMTQWPELGSKLRGRLAPDGTIQPFFEHVLANEGGYWATIAQNQPAA